MTISPSRLLGLLVLLLAGACARDAVPSGPYTVVLGIAQDGGVPQAGTSDHPAWEDPSLRRLVSCLGVVDPRSGGRWMVDATPDLPEQLHSLDRTAPSPEGRALDGIFLTHAHIGHYTGLIYLGHEAMGARGVPVHAMPRMRAFLEGSGPWNQLAAYGNIQLRTLEADRPVELAEGLSITPLRVPHRQEYAEVVGFRIQGPERAVLYIPDIDSWHELDEQGVRIEDLIAGVDRAYLDGTFFDDGEIPGRDMSGFPHPFIAKSMERFAPLPESEKRKIRFLHLNHTNPALDPGGEARRRIEEAGFAVAEEGDHFPLAPPGPGS